MNAQLTLDPARAWALDNPQAWAFMCDTARLCVAKGKRFGMRFLIEVARYEFEVKRDGAYRLNNNIQKPLGDLLRETVPGASELMESRDRVWQIREEA